MIRKLATGRSRVLVGLPVFCGWMLTATWMQAAVFNWDGGAGAWDTTTLNWDGGANAWPAAGTDHEAVFGGTAGTVTINNANTDPVAAHRLTFNSSGYVIDGDTLTFNGTNPILFVNGGVSATIEAPITGSGLLQRTSNGQLTIGGSSSNTFSGTTRFVDNSVTWLDKSGGAFALSGPVEMGNGVALQSHLRTLQSEQFAPGVVIDFINPAGQWSRFDLLGTTQTLAGMNTGAPGTLGAGVVQNRSFGDGASQHGTATLTLNGGDNYLFHGHLRNVDGGVVGDNQLSLVKQGTGTQTLVGGQITYSGGTTIDAGTLELRDTGNNFASQIEVNAGGTLDVVYSTTGVAARRDLAGPLVTGTGVININNAGAGASGAWTTVNSNNSGRIWDFDGTININSGVLTRDHVAANTIRGTATVNIAADGVLGTRGGGVIIGALNGNGRVSPLWVGASASTLTLGNGGDSGNFSGTIHGNGLSGVDGELEGGILSLVKIGGGTQTFSGTLTYTGNTDVNEGTLVLSGTTSYASGTTTVAGDGTLELHSTNAAVDNWRINTVLAGTGTINKTGSGWTQTNTNPHTFAGTFNIQEGAFGASFLDSNWTGVTADFHISAGALLDARGQAITVGSLNGAGNVGNTWSSTATLNMGAGNKSGDFSGTIHGNASTGVNNTANPNAGLLNLVKTGGGTQILGGNNTFNGTMAVNGGILYVDGANSYAGDTFVNGGYLVARHNNALGAANNSYVASGATLQLENNMAISGETAHIVGEGVDGWRGALASWTGDNAWNGAVVLTGNSRVFVQANSLAINGAISESAAGSGLRKAGLGTLTLGGTTANTYTGGTIVQDYGVLQLNKSAGVAAIPGDLTIIGSPTPNYNRVYTLADNQFGPNSVVHFQGGFWAILELLGTTQTVAGLSGDNSGIVQNRQFSSGSFGTGNLVLNGTGTYAFDGFIRDGFPGFNPNPGVLALTKQGSGTQTLGGTLDYTGTTTVEAGTLLVHGTHTGGGQYTVNAGGTLGGNGNITAGVDLFGTLSPGASIGTINTGSEVWNDGGDFLFEIDDANGTAGAAGGPGWDLLAVTGTLDLSGLSAGGFTIDVVSLLSGGGTNPGDIDNFNSSQQYLWEFVTTTGGVIGFDASLFAVDATQFSNPIGGGAFVILPTDNGLAIAFVPEPGAYILGLLGAVGVALLLWRRKKSL